MMAYFFKTSPSQSGRFGCSKGKVIAVETLHGELIVRCGDEFLFGYGAASLVVEVHPAEPIVIAVGEVGAEVTCAAVLAEEGGGEVEIRHIGDGLDLLQLQEIVGVCGGEVGELFLTELLQLLLKPLSNFFCTTKRKKSHEICAWLFFVALILKQ